MNGFKRKQSKPAKKGQSNQQSVVGDMQKGLQLSSKKLLLVALIIVLIISGVGAYLYIKNRQASTKLSSVCSESVITRQTGIDLTSTSVAGLKPTVDKILQTNYQNDPSCLFILTKYYVGVSDPVNARPAYDQLTKLYTSNDVYDANIQDAAASPQQFKQTLELLEKERQEIDRTSKVFGS